MENNVIVVLLLYNHPRVLICYLSSFASTSRTVRVAQWVLSASLLSCLVLFHRGYPILQKERKKEKKKKKLEM